MGAIELESDVVRYRIGYASVAGAAQAGIKSCTGWLASIAGRQNFQGPITPTEGWTDNLYGGSATFSAPARLNTERVSITWCDWVEAPSLERTDGGIRPILLYRYEFPVGTVVSYPTNGTAGWRDASSSPRLLTTNVQAVSGVTDKAAFTNGNNTESTTSIVVPIVQYVTKAKGRQWIIGGDSVAEGVGATPACYGYVQRALLELSTPQAPVEYFNAALHSQQPPIYSNSLADWVSTVKPTAATYQGFSINQVTNSPAGSGMNANDRKRMILGLGVATAALDGIPTLLMEGLPCNASFKAVGAGDQGRLDFNNLELPKYTAMKVVKGLADAFSGATVNGQIQYLASVSSDGVHPNQAGSILGAAIVKPYVAAM